MAQGSLFDATENCVNDSGNEGWNFKSIFRKYFSFFLRTVSLIFNCTKIKTLQNIK